MSSSGEEGDVSPCMEDTPLLAPSSEPGKENVKGEGEGEAAAPPNQEVFGPKVTAEVVHGPPMGCEDHMGAGPACTHPGPQAPNSTEANGGGASEERGTQTGGQSERKPDECLPMGEEEEGASRSQDRPRVSSADMEDEEESRDHKADESQVI